MGKTISSSIAFAINPQSFRELLAIA